ncbi:anchor protein [Opitutaceae bacterium TAV5]|nr:anchor protein [Opitutaceae bacterium TAV5]
MKTMKKLALLTTLAASLALAANANAADPLFSTDFTGTPGSIPTDFTASNFAINDNGNLYRLAPGLPSNGSQNQLSVYTGAALSGSSANYTVSSTFNLGGNGGYVGLAAYHTDASHYYLGRLNGSGSGTGFSLEIYKFNGGGANNAQLKLENFTFEQTGGIFTGRLEFTVNEGTLTLSLYESGTEGALLKSISATDTALSGGSVGVRATAAYAVSYDNLVVTSATPIPEPATAAVLTGAALLAAVVVFRRTRA